MKKTILALAIAAIAGTTSMTANAYEAGDILVRARLINVMPNDSSDDLTVGGTVVQNTDLKVEDNFSLDIDFTYMFTPNWGAELLLDISSKHDIKANGATLKTLNGNSNDIASVRVLPPSLVMQYHFAPNAAVKPYMGLGLNYTHFFDKDLDSDAKTALGASNLDLDDSWGLVGQIGADFDIGNNWFINVDAKYIDIDTTATMNTVLGKVKVDVDIDPWVIGIGIGTRF